MAEEVISITVIDPSVDEVLAKLDTARSRVRGIKSDLAEVGGLKGLSKQIPTIRRSQRLIITQIPMMREGLLTLQRLKMIMAVGGPTAAAIVGVYLAKWYERWQKDLERERASYETMIRDGLDISHKEYKQLSAEQIGYATRFDEFMAKWESKEWWDAIADYVRVGLAKPSPTVLGRVVFTGEVIDPSVEKLLEYYFAQELDEFVTGKTEEKRLIDIAKDYIDYYRELDMKQLEMELEWITNVVDRLTGIFNKDEDTDHDYDWNLSDGVSGNK